MSITIFIISILLFSPIFAQSTEYIKIDKLEIISEDNIDKDFWVDFINIPKNSFITNKDIEFLKIRLLNTKAFKKVFIKIKKQNHTNKLLFYLILKPIIKKIIILNNFPLLEQDIRRKIFFNEGEHFDKGKYNAIKENLEKLFETKGFYNSDIETSYSYSDDYKYLTIKINIKNIGVNLSIDDINIIYKKEEDKKIKDSVIKKLIYPTFWSKRTETFYEDELKKKLKEVELNLKKRGYLSAKLKLLKLPVKEELLKGKSNNYSKESIEYKIFNKYILNNPYPEYLKIKRKGFIINLKEKKVDLWLMFSLGEKVDIQFKGHKNITIKELKEKISIYESTSLSPSDIRKSIKKLKQLYQSNGYYFVDVSKDHEKEKENQLIFNIKEGKKLYIRNIILKGVNKDINKNDLLSLIETGKFNLLGSQGYLQEKLFLKDMKTILSHYKNNGYLHVKIEKLLFNFYHDKNYLDIVIKINEGEKVTFSIPKIYGENNKKEINKMQKHLKNPENKGFNYSWFKYNANAIQQYYESIGYPLATVEAYINSYLFYPLPKKFISEDEILSKLHGKLNLSYIIKKGPKKKFGSVFISGNFITKRDTITDEIIFKKDETLNLEKITETESRLRNLGIFKTISIQLPSLSEKDGIKDNGVMPTDVLFFLQEGENRYIDFLISTSTNEMWSFSTKIVEKNLLGYAKKISLLGKIGEIYSKLELGFDSPNIFSTQINLNIKTYYKYETPPAFDLTVIGNEISLYKSFFKKLTFSPSILFEYSKTEIAFSKNIFEPDIFQKIETSFTNSMKISLFYESRDNIFDPRKGFAVKYSFQWAGLFDILSNKFIELIDINVSNEKFLKNELDYSFYLSPFKWLTFANSIKVGIGKPLNTTKKHLPLKERYFLGGDSSIRGYDFNMAGVIKNGKPTGENSMLLFNSEIRFYLKNNISLAFFMDIGGLSENFSDFFESEKWIPQDTYSMFYSMGFGIRYITIVGPLRFDFVPKLNSSYINKGTTFWHFNFSYPF